MKFKNKEQKLRINKFLKECEGRAGKIKFTGEDWNNLYDYFYMSESPELDETLKLNNMDKWYHKFFTKIEKIVIPEMYKNEK